MPDIVLYNRVGAAVTYPNADSLTVDTTTEGETAKFTYGALLEGVEIVPDFSAGDQVVTVPEGYVVRAATVKRPENQVPENIRNGANVGGVVGSFIGDTEEITVELNMADGDQVIVPTEDGKVISKVVVKKPETFVEENIAKDKNIGGIIGALAVKGGCIVATGKIENTTSSPVTVNHGLGVVPDLVFLISTASARNQVSTINDVFAASNALKILVDIPQVEYYKGTGGSVMRQGYAVGGIDDTATTCLINNATESDFAINASSSHKLYANTTWYAIGGLT